MAFIRKSIIIDVYEISVALIGKQTLEVDVNLPILILCILGCVFSSLIMFVMKRMTYYKIGKRLEYCSWKIVLGTISPIFLLGFILWERCGKKKE